jgi:hypothetical protein
MSPLGQEQAFVQKQRLMQALIPAIAGFKPGGPTDPAVAAAFTPPTNFLSQLNTPGMQQSFSDQATASALADRRQMMAQVNPNYNFSSLDNFGLGTGFDQQIQQASADARTRQDEFSQRQEGLAQQGTSAVTDRMSQVTTGQPEKKKGGGIWGKIGSIAKVAVPIVLAATGVGIPAAMAITAGTNIAASKMQGKDWGDALQSGAIGAATGAVGAGALGGASRAGMSAATQKAVAQGVLSGADAKMQGGSWNDALGAGMTGAATSKVADLAKAKFQGGGSNGLNNQMGPQSLPLGSGYSDANNPGTGLFNTLKNSPQLQLASRALPSGQVPQGVEDNNASQINQMMKVVGGPKAVGPVQGPPTKQAFALSHAPTNVGPTRTMNIGERSLLQDAFTPLLPQVKAPFTAAANFADQPTLPRTPYPVINQANAMINGFGAGVIDTMGDWAAGMTSPAGIASLGFGPLAGRGISAARGLAGAESSIMGEVGAAEALAAQRAALSGEAQAAKAAYAASHPGPTSQIDVQSILNTLGKNNGMDKGAFNLAAQGAYNKVPGQIQKQLTKQQLEAIIMQMQQSPTRAKLFGGK